MKEPAGHLFLLNFHHSGSITWKGRRSCGPILLRLFQNAFPLPAESPPCSVCPGTSPHMVPIWRRINPPTPRTPPDLCAFGQRARPLRVVAKHLATHRGQRQSKSHPDSCPSRRRGPPILPLACTPLASKQFMRAPSIFHGARNGCFVSEGGEGGSRCEDGDVGGAGGEGGGTIPAADLRPRHC